MIAALPNLAAAQKDVRRVVTPAIQVSREDIRPNRVHNTQHVLVHPEDEQTLVVVESDLTDSKGGCLVHVSEDGGRTWGTRSAQPKPEAYGSCTRPTFGPALDSAFSADGKTLFVLAAGSDTASGRGTTDVYLARSDDLGESWQFTTIVKGADKREITKSDGTKDSDEGRYNRLRMAVHPTDPDKVYAGIMFSTANLPFGEAPLRSLVAVSGDGGRTFGPLVDIFADVPTDEIFGSDVPSLAVDKEGTIYAFTKERPPSPPPPPAPPAPTAAPPPTTVPATPPTTAASPVKGAGCPPHPVAAARPTPPTTAPVPAEAPRLGAAGAGDRLLFAKSTDGGTTFKGRSIDDTVAVCRFCLTTPEAAVDPDTGNVYVVFEASDTGPPTPRDDRNIWFMMSVDGGSTFTKRAQLNDDKDPARVPNYNQLFPGIDVAPNGRIDVAWYDFRTDALYNPEGRGYSNLAGETCWDVYYTFSEDGGKTWARNVRISDRSMNRHEGYALNSNYDVRGPMGMAATDDRTHVAWPDSRAANPEVPAEDTYLAAVLHRAEDPAGGSDTSPVAAFALGGGAALAIAGALLLFFSSTRQRSRPTA